MKKSIDKTLAEASSVKDFNKKLKKLCHVSLIEIQQALSAAVQNTADEVAKEFINVAPLGDYSLLIEDHLKIAEFLKTEAHKPEHWLVYGLASGDDEKEFTKFVFMNDAVDDGTTFKGYVLIDKKGGIKHAFAQAEE